MINIVGYFASESGLGVASRNIAKVVARRGMEPACSLVPSGIADPIVPPFPTPALGSIQLKFAVSLLIGGAVPGDFLLQMAQFVRGKTRLAILAYWEMTELRPEAIRFLEMADVLFAGSPFTQEVYRRYFPNKPCLELPCPVDLVEPSPGDARARFGLPANVPLILASFSPGSDTGRKNPEGALRAFMMSSADHDAKFVLKVHWPRGVAADSQYPMFKNCRDMIEEARRNPRIIVIDEALEYPDLLALYACVDAIISLHRSEGLGLVLLEAMALGKPLIATGFSGNMAFMDASYAGLVRYALVPVVSEHSYYQADRFIRPPVWAEPDLAHAAQLMTRVITDAAFADRLRADGIRMAESYRTRAEAAQWLSPPR